MTLAPQSLNPQPLQRTPLWVKLAWIPWVGGLAVGWASWRLRQVTQSNGWLVLGSPLLVLSVVSFFVRPLWGLIFPVWVGQIIFALATKRSYLIYVAPKGSIIPKTRDLAMQLARVHGKVDINNASKDDLVNVLGIPIAYANIIQEFQREGITFEDLEHLKTITGIPGEYLNHLEPMLTYGVRYQEELNYSWHRLNTMTAEELQFWGLDREVAEKVVQERSRRGRFQSVLEVTRRTGVSLAALKPIL